MIRSFDKIHPEAFAGLKAPTVTVNNDDCLTLEQMKKLDNHAVNKYQLPVELMMENAGYQLARVVSKVARPGSKVVVGCGTGNNAGGGLVAARRLLAWEYDIYLDIPDKKLKDLPAIQLERTLSFGAKTIKPLKPDCAIDAYFGFSLRLPVPEHFVSSFQWINNLTCPVISLDIPSGITENMSKEDNTFVKPNAVCTLAAPKKVLFSLDLDFETFLVDIGIPSKAFEDLCFSFHADFSKDDVIRLIV